MVKTITVDGIIRFDKILYIGEVEWIELLGKAFLEEIFGSVEWEELNGKAEFE